MNKYLLFALSLFCLNFLSFASHRNDDLQLIDKLLPKDSDASYILIKSNGAKKYVYLISQNLLTGIEVSRYLQIEKDRYLYVEDLTQQEFSYDLLNDIYYSTDILPRGYEIIPDDYFAFFRVEDEAIDDYSYIPITDVSINSHTAGILAIVSCLLINMETLQFTENAESVNQEDSRIAVLPMIHPSISFIDKNQGISYTIDNLEGSPYEYLVKQNRNSLMVAKRPCRNSLVDIRCYTELISELKSCKKENTIAKGDVFIQYTEDADSIYFSFIPEITDNIMHNPLKSLSAVMLLNYIEFDRNMMKSIW